MREVLLTFVGYRDPYYKSTVEGEELKGPILYLLSLRGFDAVYLFTAPNTMAIASETARALSATHPQTVAQVVSVPIDDPINYGQIIGGVRSAFRRIQRENASAAYSIATASGTPQMHASWLMLAASGEIPARILQARPPQFVSAGRQAIEEIDLRGRPEPAPLQMMEQESARMALPGYLPSETARWLESAAVAQQPPLADRLRQELGIIGAHALFVNALEIAALLAVHTTPVLITGETGTGKEMVATFIHRLSGRPAEKLVAVNCAAVPEPLAESILFGHRKGAFTGATENAPGKFAEADGGTLFLDEIGELPDAVQAKLLRVLQDGVVEPVGSAKGKKVNVRIIAGTNRDLRAEAREKRFRQDLLFRIEVGIVRLPPLRERRSDIPLLAMGLLDNLNRHLRTQKRFSPAAIEALAAHDWPGNVRDLLNTLERTVILRRGEVIEPDDLQFSDTGSYAEPGPSGTGAGTGARLPDPAEGFYMEEFFSSARRSLITRALEMANGNKTAAARLLGITPQAIHNFLRRENGEGAVEA
jgi:DNA-binding NtrC family response regulator